MADFSVTQVVETGGPQVFLIRVPDLMPSWGYENMVRVWEETWRRAGADRAPPLLIMPHSLELEALSGARLAEVGLMAIPQPEGSALQ